MRSCLTGLDTFRHGDAEDQTARVVPSVATFLQGIRVDQGDQNGPCQCVAESQPAPTERGQRAVAEVSVWLGAFSPLYSVEPLRRGRANIAASLPFDCGAPWALPKCSRLHFGRCDRYYLSG